MDKETYLEIFGTKRWRHKRWITSEEYNRNRDHYDKYSNDFEFIVDGISLDEQRKARPESYICGISTENSPKQNGKFNFNYKIYGTED